MLTAIITKQEIRNYDEVLPTLRDARKRGLRWPPRLTDVLRLLKARLSACTFRSGSHSHTSNGLFMAQINWRFAQEIDEVEMCDCE
jgi:hypothetical protein